MEFSSADEAAEAIKKFDGQEVDGRKLRVNTAEDRPRRPDGGRFSSPRPSRPGEMGDPAAYAAAPPWGGGFDGGGGAGGGGRPFKTKGSRRGLRARKRSLSF